jgi:8-oxo-dGTP diphosphatase
MEVGRVLAAVVPTTRVPRIGVAVIVIRDGQVLIGRRRSTSHGDETWQFPGGHLEFGESIADGAVREVAEETGLEATVTGYGPYTNDVFVADGKHYVTLFVLAAAADGIPQVMEPEKCAEWRWCPWDALPDPRFLSIQHLLELGYRPPGVV